MLQHKELICELHGQKCLNENGEENCSQPAYYNNDKWYRLNHRSSLSVLFKAAESTCPILKLFAMIGILRRSEKDIELDYDYDVFFEALRDHIWYVLENASVRICLSIIETYADSPTKQDAGTAAMLFLRLERIARMVSIQKTSIGRVSPGRISGMRPTCFSAPDTVRNTFKRLRIQLFKQPILWLVFYKVLTFDLEAEDHTFKRCDNLKFWEVHSAFPPCSAEEYARRLLCPSTISLKYNNLYEEHHNLKSNYGAGGGFPIDDAKFLKSNEIHDVLDFGCGHGNRETPTFEWYKYDPCTKHNTLPYRSFDAVVSYDVLEHIPEDELGVVAQWIELYAKKCIVLGISTRLAGAILPNGENAHCTVRDADWWANKIQELIPRFKLQWKHPHPTRSFVTLHLRRVH